MDDLYAKPPPPKWQPKKPATKNEKKFYTFTKGQVEKLDYEKLSDLKRARSEEMLRNKGKFFLIEKPQTLIEKRLKVQDKLWYYDKRNYPEKPKPVKPMYNMYFIRPPNTADRLRRDLESHRSPTPPPPLEPIKPKSPLPKPMTPVISPEPKIIIRDSPPPPPLITASLIAAAALPVVKIRNSYKTNESINKSMIKYRY